MKTLLAITIPPVVFQGLYWRAHMGHANCPPFVIHSVLRHTYKQSRNLHKKNSSTPLIKLCAYWEAFSVKKWHERRGM